MPGGPTETLIGALAIGGGTILVYAAYKNKNPFEIVREAITTGQFPDLSKLPSLFGGSSASIKGPDLTKIVSSQMKSKDPDLAKRVTDAINAYAKDPNESGQAGLLLLTSEMMQKGYTTEAKALVLWINQHPQSGLGRDIVPDPLGTQQTDVTV